MYSRRLQAGDVLHIGHATLEITEVGQKSVHVEIEAPEEIVIEPGDRAAPVRQLSKKPAPAPRRGWKKHNRRR